MQVRRYSMGEVLKIDTTIGEVSSDTTEKIRAHAPLYVVSIESCDVEAILADDFEPNVAAQDAIREEIRNFHVFQVSIAEGTEGASVLRWKDGHQLRVLAGLIGAGTKISFLADALAIRILQGRMPR